MRRVGSRGGRLADLLARPPCTAREAHRPWGPLAGDPIAQLRELADLRRRGLLSRQLYERQRARVLAPRSGA